jgi:MFS family permease
VHDEPGPWSARYRSITVGLFALVSLGAFETMAVTAVMPSVAAALDGLALYAPTFAALLVTQTIALVLAGSWCDRRGPAGPLWTGTALFAVGLLLAGTAVAMPAVLLGRAVQGLGTGLVNVAVYVVIGQAYPERARAVVFTGLSAAWVVPAVVGPGLAGLVAEHLGWRWVFLGVPALFLPAAWAARRGLVGTGRSTGPPGPARLGRRLLLATGAAAALTLLSLAAEAGRWALVPVLLAVTVLAACLPPLLPPGAWRLARGLPSVVGLRGLVAAAFFGAEAFVPLLLSRERGLSPSLAGLSITGSAVTWFVGSWLVSRPWLPWPRTVWIGVGGALMAAGIAVTAAVAVPAVPVAVAFAGWVLAGLGIGLAYPLLSVLLLDLSPPAEHGVNSTALQLAETLGAAVGLSLGGLAFGALLERSATGAYLAVFGVAALLAAAVGAAATRVRDRGSAGTPPTGPTEAKYGFSTAPPTGCA